MIVLGCLDLDHAFRLECHAALTNNSISVERTAHEKWERSNRMCLMIMQHSIPESLRVSYNTQKEKWSLNELIAQCVQEEEMHKQNKVESAHLASSFSAKASKKRKKNDKGTANNGESNKNVQKKQDTDHTCFFCKKHGQVKDCPKFAD
ncbi:Retrovirus-related Pol polyprotein from transposon TNT 1-94 [Senna tora]|uniref:Retrovirus-related Pol polyprotein from transposon TNT 1-94 n=1 Tax=Senna tora TaxID=362788 RepID=A0A834WT62_9FABA|nr:Retrovirus-related Pol polyprotein from transposon TNT 1-94 [Senna tora]